MAEIYDGILESYKAREIAEENKKEHGVEQTEEEAAMEWFAAVISDGCTHEEEKPLHSRYVDKIDCDWELYYDYGADYYFAVKES